MWNFTGKNISMSNYSMNMTSKNNARSIGNCHVEKTPRKSFDFTTKVIINI
jgi:hypothetical protein